MKIGLGEGVKDTITGACGVVVGRLEHITNPVEYQVQPQICTTEGKPVEPFWLSEPRAKRDDTRTL